MAASVTAAGPRTGGSSIPTPKGVSRLGQMQAKLQEQLMVEKESRLLEMAARQEAERDHTIQRVTKSSASSLSSSLSSLSLGSTMSGQGRVRRLFEDRRSTGYDKSYPLVPVKGKTSDSKPPVRGVVKSSARAPPGKSAYGGGYGQPRSRSQVSSEQRGPKPNNLNRQNNNPGPRLGWHKSNPSLLDADNNPSNNNSSSRFGRKPSPAPSVNGRGPSPLPPSTAPQRRPPARKPAPSAVKSKPSPSPSPRPKPQPSPSTPFAVQLPASLAPSPFPVRRGSTASERKGPRPVPPGMKQCPVCERNFNEDRIQKHAAICQKTATRAKKRKAFDPVKMRNKGTEAEKYVARGLHLKEVKTKKKDWRKQHEDFIKTVRAAKGMKGYEAPPLDVSDYVQCPHCGRKFNQAAGDRHIPKCSDIKSNKPSVGKRR